MQWCNGTKVQMDKDAKMQRHKGTKVQRCNTALYNNLVLHSGMALLNCVALFNGAA